MSIAATQIGEAAVEAVAESVSEIGDFFSNLFKTWGENAISWLIRLAVCILVFVIARFVLKKLIAFIGKKMDKRGAPKSLKSILLWILNYGVTIYLLVQMLIVLDLVKSASIAALVAAMGVGISLALQGAFSNFAGGILLILLKPFKEGDYIVVDGSNGVEGTVTEIHVYYTTLVTVYNDQIRVPNSALTNHSIKNLMAEGNKRLELHIGISYDEDIERVLKILEELVDKDERIFKDRRAFFVHELGAHSVILGIRCVVKRQDFLVVQWDLNKAIRLRFKKEGIEIPYEQLDVHFDYPSQPPENKRT